MGRGNWQLVPASAGQPVVAQFDGLVAGRVAALAADPAEVHRRRDRRRPDVQLLPPVLSHVADVHVAGEAVEREAERVAQPQVPDLVAGGLLVEEGVRRGHGVVAGHHAAVVGRPGAGIDAVHVDAKHLAEQAVGALAVAVGALPAVAATATVAGRDVEEAVRPERELAAVVVGGGGVLDHHDGRGRGGIGHVGVAGRALCSGPSRCPRWSPAPGPGACSTRRSGRWSRSSGRAPWPGARARRRPAPARPSRRAGPGTWSAASRPCCRPRPGWRPAGSRPGGGRGRRWDRRTRSASWRRPGSRPARSGSRCPRAPAVCRWSRTRR